VVGLEVIEIEAVLLTFPFAAFGFVWLVGRVVFGNGADQSGERVEPPSPNEQRRPSPGGRRDNSD
jgi:hypothetical protein